MQYSVLVLVSDEFLSGLDGNPPKVKHILNQPFFLFYCATLTEIKPYAMSHKEQSFA